MVDSSAPIARWWGRPCGCSGHRTVQERRETVTATPCAHSLGQERHLIHGCGSWRAYGQKIRFGAGVAPSISSGAPGRARRSGFGALPGLPALVTAGGEALLALPQAVAGRADVFTVDPSAGLEQFTNLGTVGGLFGVPKAGARRGTDPD